MSDVKISDVRAALMSTLTHLGSLGRDKKPLDAEQIKAQVSLANSMKGVADSLVDTARVEIEYLRAIGGDSSAFMGSRGPALPAPTPPTDGSPTANNPFPTSVRHRIQG